MHFLKRLWSKINNSPAQDKGAVHRRRASTRNRLRFAEPLESRHVLSSIALFDGSTGVHYLKHNHETGFADTSYLFGSATTDMHVLAGDWNGDTQSRPGLYNPATGDWFLTNAFSNGMAEISFVFGPANSGMVALAGDWDGNGEETIGLYDPATGTWFLSNSLNNPAADITLYFGPAGATAWQPVVGDWNGDGTDTVGLFDGSTGLWHLRNSNTTGDADVTFLFGGPNLPYQAVAGDFNLDGTTDAGLYHTEQGVWYENLSLTSGFAHNTFVYGDGNSSLQAYTGDWTPPAAPTAAIIEITPDPRNTHAGNVTIEFSEVVTNVDISDFSLWHDGNLVDTSGLSVIQTGSTEYDIDFSSVTSGAGTYILTLLSQGSGIQDVTRTPMAGYVTEGWLVDLTPPVVQSINRINDEFTNADYVSYQITFSKAVNFPNTNPFTVSTTGGATFNHLSYQGGGTNYTATIHDVTGDGTLQLNLVDDDGIVDIAGNTLGGTGAGNGDFSGETYTIDNTAPTVVSITREDPEITNLNDVRYVITYSEWVDHPENLNMGVSGVTFSSTSFDDLGNNQYRLTVSGVQGDGTLQAAVNEYDDVFDLAGNPLGGPGHGNGNVAGGIYTIDNTAPTVVSITREDPDITNLDDVRYVITYSEWVDHPENLNVGVSGVTFSSTTFESLGSNQYRLTVGGVQGDGTLQAAVNEHDDVFDLAGNPLGGPGHGNGNLSGGIYTIDNTAPTVVSVTRTQSFSWFPFDYASMDFLVTFSEHVAEFAGSDVAYVGDGFYVNTIATSGYGDTHLVQGHWVDFDLFEFVVLHVLDDNLITDLAGNAMAGDFVNSEEYFVDF